MDYNGYRSSATAFYYERDIQGSITSVWDVNGNYPIQFTDYYADGLPKNNSWGTSTQPNLYIGKEYISMHGYDSYDFGARHTYTALGRFSTMDPLSEKYYSTSPYAYCAGNPVRYVDPDGNEIKIETWYGRLLAKFGVNNFEAKVQKQLNNIKSISPGLNQMVTALEKTSETYNIKPSEKDRTNHYTVDNKTVYFNPDDTNGYDGKYRPAEAGLAHELGHAEDDKNGNRIDYDRNKLNNHDVIEMDKCQRNEINAISRENEVRDAMGYPERDYNYFTVKKEDN